MGSRKVVETFCDKCGKEIIGRLTLHTCPCCSKDICVSCQLKEDNKHKPRERKPKVEPIVGVITERKKRPNLIIEDTPEIADKKGENLTIHVPTGVGDDTDYVIKVAGSEARSPVGLRVTVLAALEEFNGKIPECLSDYEKEIIRSILENKEGRYARDN